MYNIFQNDSDKLKVSFWSDSPYVTSGFGAVNKMIIQAALKRDWEISVLGALDFTMDPVRIKAAPFNYFPTISGDEMGERFSPDFIRITKPDRIFLLGDPGSLDRRLYILRNTGMTSDGCKVITYFPIEGLPLFPSIANQARSSDAPITYCKFGQEELKKEGVDNVGQAYHGWDHYTPESFTAEEKQHLKNIFGFNDSFVVAQIGVNKRTNNQPKVIEAASIIKKNWPNKASNIIFYLHCKAVDQHILGGYDLTWMPNSYDVTDMILIKPDKGEYKYAYEPYKDKEMNKEFFLNLKRPPKWEDRMALWHIAPYSIKMNCFDLVIDPSSVQGFGLPPLEAIVTGIPIISVNDGTCRSEIYGDVCYMMEPDPENYSIWHLGTKLIEISANQIATAVIDWYINYDKLYEKHQVPAYKKFKEWTWDGPANYICDAIELGSTQF